MDTSTECEGAFEYYLVSCNRVGKRQQSFTTDSWISLRFSPVSNGLKLKHQMI